MAQREIQIQEGQWEAVAHLMAAVASFDRAYEDLQKAKNAFEIAPMERFQMDLDRKRIIVIGPGPSQPMRNTDG